MEEAPQCDTGASREGYFLKIARLFVSLPPLDIDKPFVKKLPRMTERHFVFDGGTCFDRRSDGALGGEGYAAGTSDQRMPEGTEEMRETKWFREPRRTMKEAKAMKERRIARRRSTMPRLTRLTRCESHHLDPTRHGKTIHSNR